MNPPENLICRTVRVTNSAIDDYRKCTGDATATRDAIGALLKGVILRPAPRGEFYLYDSGWLLYVLSRRNAHGKRRGAATFNVISVQLAKG